MRPKTTEQPKLSPLEWQAVSLALKDAETCGCGRTDEPGLLGRLVQRIFPPVPVLPLANPRLEAVRRFVCETERQRRPAVEFAPALKGQGFNDRQIRALALLSGH
jgi:hypothetical protein